MTYHYSQVEIREYLVGVENYLNSMSKRSRSFNFYMGQRELILQELIKIQIREFDCETQTPSLSS